MVEEGERIQEKEVETETETEKEDIIQMGMWRGEVLKQMTFATIVGKLDTGNLNSILFYIIPNNFNANLNEDWSGVGVVCYYLLTSLFYITYTLYLLILILSMDYSSSIHPFTYYLLI